MSRSLARTLRGAAVGALATLAGTAFATTAAAHPHVWIDAHAVLVFDGAAVKEIEIHWAFDEIYSSLVAADFDENDNGRLDAAELSLLAEMSGESLGDFSFFTHLQVAGERRAVDTVEDLRVSLEDDRLRYTFRVPLGEGVDPRSKGFAFGLYDATYYVALTMDQIDPVRFKGDWPGSCHFVLVEDDENPIYFGMVNPLVVQVRCDVA